MSDFIATFDQARKRLRHKLGLPAALPPNVETSAASSDGSSSGVSVLHRVLAFEDHKQVPVACDPPDSDIIPLPAALSHSLSGTWKQRVDDKGKPIWQRDAREAASNEVIRLCLAACCTMKPCRCYFGHHYSASPHPVQQSRGLECEDKLTFQVMKEEASAAKQDPQELYTVCQQAGSGISAEQPLARDGQLFLQLPHVQSLHQAKQQSDALQLQAYKKTRKLQGMVAILCSCDSHLASHDRSVQKCICYTFCDWGGMVSWLSVTATMSRGVQHIFTT